MNDTDGKQKPFDLFSRPAWILFPAVLPLLAIAYFIASYRANIPFWDEWVLVPEIHKLTQGHSILPGSWAQHGEQRYLIARLILTAVAALSHWNVQLQRFLNLGIAVGTYIQLQKLSKPLNTKTPDTIDVFAGMVTALSVFSFAAWESWIWSWSVGWFLCAFAVVSSVISLGRSDRSERTRLYAGAAWCTIASLSTANGLLSWLSAIPVLLTFTGTSRQKIRRIAIWLAGFTVLATVYAIGYLKPPGMPSFLTSLHQPLSIWAYMAAILGTPLSGSLAVARTFGTLLVAVFILFCIRVRRAGIWTEVVAPMSVGIFVLLFGVVVTAGRIFLGPGSALASRYVTTSALLIVCTVQLGATLVRRNGSPRSRMLFIFSCLLIAVLLVSTIPESVHQMKISERSQLVGEQALQIRDYLEPGALGALGNLFPRESELRSGADTLERDHVRMTRKVVTFASDDPAAHTGAVDSRRAEVDPQSINVIRGTLAIASTSYPPLVLISRDDERRFIAAGTTTAGPKADSRWVVEVAGASSADAHLLRAWVYAPDRSQFYPLKGQVEVVQAWRERR